jgi:hypothetical protein
MPSKPPQVTERNRSAKTAMTHEAHGRVQVFPARGLMTRADRELPRWHQVLAVVAHSDDETFGLGGIADRFGGDGPSVNVLCFTHGGASTLNARSNDAPANDRAGAVRVRGPRSATTGCPELVCQGNGLIP